MKKYCHIRLLFLLAILCPLHKLFSQQIIFDEEFLNNQNGWRVVESKNEVSKIVSGKYKIYNYTSLFPNKPQLFYTIKRNHDFEEFSFEAEIINKEREEVYEIFHLESAISTLDNKNYKKKHYQKIKESLIKANNMQLAGGRFHWDLINNHFELKKWNKSFDWEPYEDGVSFIHWNKELISRGVQFGLVWGKKSNYNTYYEFGIFPDLKAYWVISTINGNETILRGPEKSYTIKGGVTDRDNTNKLAISKKNGFYYFYINNQEVTKLKEEYFSLAGDEIGFYMGSESHVWIENAKLETSNDLGKYPIPPVKINGGYTSSGTGFLISNKGHIVSNFHVIEDATEIDVETRFGGITKISKAKVVVADKNNDLVILKIDGINSFPSPVYGFNPNTIDVGTSVYAMGYPLLGFMGDEVKITDGIISSKTGYQGDISSYQISAPIQPGNSGGALFDKSGNLVGITNAGIQSAQNVGYAIKTSYLKNLIDLLPDKVTLESESKVKNLAFTEQIKRLGEFIVIVKIKEEKKHR